jgi:hypothetical protein
MGFPRTWVYCAHLRVFVVHILGLGICGYGCGYGVDNLCIYFLYIGFWGFLGVDRNTDLRFPNFL